PFFRNIKFVGREANVKSTRSKFDEKEMRIFSFLSKRSFRILDAIICQSNDMINDFEKSMKIDESKFVVINNPITDGFIHKSKPSRNGKVIRYITVGTLHKRKGHERILKILSNVDHPFHYTIIGNGKELALIEKLISELKLSKCVQHVPYTKEVPRYLEESDLFLNGSYVEGFPNVLIESCAVGTPVVAFDAPGGINEIIKEGLNGYIVHTEDEYIKKLNEINADNTFESKSVSDSVISRYGKNIIIEKYEKLFKDLVKGNPIK
ncbi:MAG: glycosyltransferase, partial [Flavobacteriaceae bacterium]|nr:glycosyltransferase [Flavobacteriaceae bacterium]